MIVFDISETLFFNIGIDVFSGIITLIILYSYKRDFADTYSIRLMRMIEAAVLLILLTDIVMWILNGKSGDYVRALSYIDNIIYFILQIVAALFWLRYAWYRIFGHSMPRKNEAFYVLVPFIILSMIVIASPLNGWCFYLDDANYYHRGVLSAPMSVVILAYLLSVSVIALSQYRKEVLIDRKKELLTIAFFAVPPFLGGVAQTVFYGLSMVWPCAVVSSLMILLNRESQVISQDTLTGLNNRRNMERHLRTYEEGQNRPVTLIMLDVNDFKHINDQYGHYSGDMALIQTSNILRSTFNGTSAFLARYGGDEFVIVMPEGKESTAEETTQKIKNNFDVFNRSTQFPFRLTVSAGYAISTEKADNRTANLLREADENMYQDKSRYHREKQTQQQ